MFHFMMWINECLVPSISQLHYIWGKHMGDIFSIETRMSTCIFGFCIDVDGCVLDQCERNGYVKQWKYFPLTPNGPHPTLTWQKDAHWRGHAPLEGIWCRFFKWVRYRLIVFLFGISSLMFQLPNLYKHIMINVLNCGYRWSICCHFPLGKKENVAYYLLWCMEIKKHVGLTISIWGVHIPNWWHGCDGSFFWNSEKEGCLYYL